MRDHVEFLQSQNIAWEDAAPDMLGASCKLLSHDPASGARTYLFRAPAGWAGPQRTRAAGLELYLIEGELDLGAAQLAAHNYLYAPGGTALAPRALSASLGIVFESDPAEPHPEDVLAHVDAGRMDWDVSTYDPKLSHMRLARKVLRLDPRDGCRTYLLTGLPHGWLTGDSQPLERHPHAEEMFMIHGVMTSPQGVMAPGAYFYRPAGIWHGHHSSELGFLMILRNPGSNVVITEWGNTALPLPDKPGYDPILPADAPEALRRPVPTKPAY